MDKVIENFKILKDFLWSPLGVVLAILFFIVLFKLFPKEISFFAKFFSINFSPPTVMEKSVKKIVLNEDEKEGFIVHFIESKLTYFILKTLYSREGGDILNNIVKEINCWYAQNQKTIWKRKIKSDSIKNVLETLIASKHVLCVNNLYSLSNRGKNTFDIIQQCIETI